MDERGEEGMWFETAEFATEHCRMMGFLPALKRSSFTLDLPNPENEAIRDGQ